VKTVKYHSLTGNGSGKETAMTDRKKLVLIDGHALAYRAFHALPPDLATTKGELTNAVYGFTSMLLAVLRDEQPDYLAVAFDVGKTFRHETYPAYKGTRLKMPDALPNQIERIREIIRAFNIPIFEVDGYEADDVLGALARQASQQGVETLIVTGDTDTFQLISPDVHVMISRRQFSDTVIYDEEAVRQRYGLEPHQLVDFKALTGDVSDNIPGVPGIGEKTAAALLQQYGSVEELLAHAEEIPNKRVRQGLLANREQVLMAKKLATIITEVPVQLDLSACRVADYDPDAVKALFRELEFKSLFDRLPPARPKAAQQLKMFPTEEALAPGVYRVIHTPQELDKLIAELSQAPAIALDVEATDTDAMRADLVGVALAVKPGAGYYIPVGHRLEAGSWKLEAGSWKLEAGNWKLEAGNWKLEAGSGKLEAGSGKLEAPPVSNLPLDLVRQKLGPLLADPEKPKIAHNAKYDLTVLLRHGFDVSGELFDTMVAAWLLEPERRGFGLKDLVWAKIGADMQPITELIGTGRQQITMDRVPVQRVAEYAGADVDMTLRLAQMLAKDLREKGLWDLFHRVEMPLVPILTEMEMTGVLLDVPYLHEISRELYQRIGQEEAAIYAEVGFVFNINSTQQLGQVLFEHLKLPALRRTKTGYSTAADVLEELQVKHPHPVLQHLLQYRELTKLKSTYVDALPLLVNRQTGRVHTSYNQTGTVTGRISSSDPNLQNIPIRTEEGRRIRRAFIAAPGYRLLAADYSQIELRIMAHVSGDEGLLAAFRRGEDIHASTAATIFGVPLSAVTPEMRRVAKMINFGLSYGMSGYGLAQRTGLSQEEADRFVATYFTNYPGVRKYMDRTRRQAAKQGYVETLLGRRRYFPEFQSGRQAHAAARSRAEREAINMPIQGSASDIIKLAMIRLHRSLKEAGLGARMILQVHDELVLEVPQDEIRATVPVVREAMEGALQLAIPLKVDIKVGPNWEEMAEVSG